MKLRIILCLLVVLIFASACANNQITASAISDLPVEDQIEIEAKVVSAEACKDVICGSNSKCVNGNCVCNSGYKKCSGDCILENMCCVDSDCGEYESCRENHCATNNCGVNEVFDITAEKCDCKSDSKYCPAQKKCIPKSNCCMNSDCDSNERCVFTRYLAVVCVEGGKKQCRSISSDRGESFSIDGVRYDAEISRFLQDKGLEIKVNDITFILRGSDAQKIGDNVDMYLESIEATGGNCKYDD